MMSSRKKIKQMWTDESKQKGSFKAVKKLKEDNFELKSKYFDADYITNDNDNIAKVSKRKHIKIKMETESESNWEPNNWRLLYDNIRKMRENGDAPVDSMGCDQCHDINISPNEQRFQMLVALMLSSQTRDQVTHEAMMRLREKGLSLKFIIDIDEKELAQLLKPVSFYNTKAKNIKKAAEICYEKYNCDIPDTVQTVCELPGVGFKMAHLLMKTAWDKITGIGVDTHVHRISNRLGWTKKKTKTPLETQVELESWLPRNFWSQINHELVGFGQSICRPVNPKCSDCLNKDICPSAFKESKNKKEK